MIKRGVKTAFLLVFTLLMATGIDAIAQRGRGMVRMGGMEQVCPNIPNLTEAQREQITNLRTAHLQEMQSYRDQIDINRIRYRALMRGDRTDLAAINANIDERAAIRSQMEKKQAAHHQAIRSLLTEEQRAWFDAAPGGVVRGAGFRQAGPGRQGGFGPVGPGSRRGFRRGF